MDKDPINPNAPLHTKRGEILPMKVEEKVEEVEEEEEEISPEWRNGPEWQTMLNARQNFVEAEYNYNEAKDSKDVDDQLKAYRRGIGKECYNAYQESKEAVKRKISEHVLAGVDYGMLSSEEKKKIDSKVKLYIINEIHSTEYRAYRKAQKEKEQLEIIVSAKEMLGRALSNRAVKWYLGIKWYYRIPATTALLTAAGYGLGLAAVGATLSSAGAFAGIRMARGVATFLGGTAVRGGIEKVGRLVEEGRKEDFEGLASAENLSEQEVEQTVRGIEEHHEKVQKWINRAKVASGFAVAGLGMYASASMAGAKTAGSSLGEAVDNPPAAPRVPPVEPPHTPDVTPTEPPPAEPPAPEVPETAETAKVAEGLFADPEVVKVEVANGSSTWNILKDIMENNEKFKNLSGSAEEVIAKKTFVISNLTNEAIRQGDAIGLGQGGSIKIGDELDFSKIFADKAKVEDILDKAEALSKSQMQNVTEINGKVAEWVSDPQNAGKPLTPERVAEILRGNTEAPTVPDTSVPDIDIGEKLGELDYKLGSSVLKAKFPEEVAKLAAELKKLEAARGELETHSEGSSDYEELANNLKNQIEDVETQLSTLSKKLVQKEELKDEGGLAGLGNVQDDILNNSRVGGNLGQALAGVSGVALGVTEGVKGKFGMFEGGNVRSMAGDVASARSFESKSENTEVDAQFNNKFTEIYGERGLFRTKPGVDTPEGRFMLAQNWANLLKYSRGDVKSSGLSQDSVQTIQLSKKHQKFIEEIRALDRDMKDAGVLVTLQPDVKVPEAMKKIVTAIMKGTPKAA